jgi:hypothetical protein
MPGPDSILRYNLDGTGEEMLITGLNNPSRIVLGPATGGGAGEGEAAGPTSKIYWTDGDGLHRANLNGSSPQLLIPSGAPVGGETALTRVERGADGLPGGFAVYAVLAALIVAGATAFWYARRA